MSGLPRPLSAALYRGIHRNREARSIGGRYARYEMRKAAWTEQNPGATPTEYEAAVSRIARECRV